MGVCENYSQLAPATRQVTIRPTPSSLMSTSSLLSTLARLALQSLQRSSPELATSAAAPTRYISSTPKSRGALMRHGRRFCSSFIILLPPIPAHFYQAPAGPHVFSSDINQLSGQAGAPIMPY